AAQCESGTARRMETGWTRFSNCAARIMYMKIMARPKARRKFCPVSWSVRSEERRVGKECRCRWVPDHDKKKDVKHDGREAVIYHEQILCLLRSFLLLSMKSIFGGCGVDVIR